MKQMHAAAHVEGGDFMDTTIESVGQTLQNHRIAHGLSIIEVSEKTKIRCVFIQALEADDFSALPGGVVATGFIRNYSIFLDLNPDPLIALYLKCSAKHDSAMPLKFYLPHKQTIVLDAKTIMISIVLVIAAMCAWYYYTKDHFRLPRFDFYQADFLKNSLDMDDDSSGEDFSDAEDDIYTDKILEDLDALENDDPAVAESLQPTDNFELSALTEKMSSIVSSIIPLPDSLPTEDVQLKSVDRALTENFTQADLTNKSTVTRAISLPQKESTPLTDAKPADALAQNEITTSADASAQNQENKNSPHLNIQAEITPMIDVLNDTWIKIINTKGERRLVQYLKQGDQISLSLFDGELLSVGDAEHLEFIFNGTIRIKGTILFKTPIGFVENYKISVADIQTIVQSEKQTAPAEMQNNTVDLNAKKDTLESTIKMPLTEHIAQKQQPHKALNSTLRNPFVTQSVPNITTISPTTTNLLTLGS